MLKIYKIILNVEPPDFPRNLHVIEKGSRHINLGWTTSQDGNSPITQYIIEYKTESGECNRIAIMIINGIVWFIINVMLYITEKSTC